jgi:hypothetical protein
VAFLFLNENADAERVGVIFLMIGPGRESRAFFVIWRLIERLCFSAKTFIFAPLLKVRD